MSASTRGIASPTSTGAAAHVCDVIPSRNFICLCERRIIVNRAEHLFELKSVLHWEDECCEQITGMLAHDSHAQDPVLARFGVRSLRKPLHRAVRSSTVQFSQFVSRDFVGYIALPAR
jgi:hypothetical protein